MPSKAAQLRVRAEEALMRGRFAVKALRRLAAADDPAAQFEREKAYFRAHQQARQDRRKVARMIDAAVDVYGRKLGWYLGPNENHCAICTRAAGKNFSAHRPPRVGFPSVAHPNCMCSPGAPFPGAPTLP